MTRPLSNGVASIPPAVAVGPPWAADTSQVTPEVTQFLQGPQPRGFEFVRALRIFWELINGFRSLHFVGPCVTVFG
jgi:hypothetical protein